MSTALTLRRRQVSVWVVGFVLLAVATLLAAAHGAANISYGAVAAILLERFGIDLGATYSLTDQLIVEFIRLPRIVASMLVGAALGVAGTVTQGVFRNPLADPGLIGISAGAATGAVAAIALGLPAISALLLPATAFGGAIVAALLVVGLGGAKASRGTGSLLMAGIAVSSFLGAVTSTVLASTESRDLLREMLFWLLGGFDNRDWSHVGLIVLPVTIGSVAIFAFARDLNLLSLGDEGAQGLGVPVRRTRILLLVLAALVAAVAVSISGTIAFVGLVVPHLLRSVVGPDHRVLLPASALGGALFLLVADTIARLALQPVELRVGIVTAFVGAPFFLFVLNTNRRLRVP